MPTSKILKDAREGKGSVPALEKKWKRAEDIAEKGGKVSYPLAMHIYKRMTHQASFERITPKAATGAIIYASDTKQFLFQLRGIQSDMPHTWGTFGGTLEPGESIIDGLVREIYEETGYHGTMALRELTSSVSRDKAFTYYTWLCTVPNAFVPAALNRQFEFETDGYAWVDYGAWPEPLHPGLEDTLSRASIQAILINLDRGFLS